jgi:hypothetical protein
MNQSPLRQDILLLALAITERAAFTTTLTDYLVLTTPYAPHDPVQGCFLGTLALAAMELGHIPPPPNTVLYFPRRRQGVTLYCVTLEPLLQQLEGTGFSRSWLQQQELRYLRLRSGGGTVDYLGRLRLLLGEALNTEIWSRPAISFS